MPRQMPTTPGPRIRAQARGGSLLLTFPIGGRGSRHRRPLPDRPPTLQAFRSVLSETQSVSTQWLINGSRSYLRRHGVQSRGAAISYHKLTLSVYRKFCRAWKAWRRTGRSPIPTPLRSLRSLRQKHIKAESTPPSSSKTPKHPAAKAIKYRGGWDARSRSRSSSGGTFSTVGVKSFSRVERVERAD